MEKNTKQNLFIGFDSSHLEEAVIDQSACVCATLPELLDFRFSIDFQIFNSKVFHTIS